jgi:small GTP-binding protein
LEGHADGVSSVAWSSDGRHAFSSAQNGVARTWDLSGLLALETAPDVKRTSPRTPEQVQYTNAKVLLVGDTSAGKTGLAHRLATGQWKPSDGSTVGAWSTQWKLDAARAGPGVEREIWLWDFGGQADQRLIHQLYMDRSALILLLFNADQEDVLPGLRDWQTALRRCVPSDTPQLLVAGRIDAGFKAARGKLQRFAAENRLGYHETSARDGTGCAELCDAIMSLIPWAQMPVITTEQLFKLIKDEILKLRDEGKVLHTFKELRDLLLHRLPDEHPFTDDALHTVIGLLDGPGIVKELDYGTYVLLQPEWVNAYAQAVLRTLRSSEHELGVLPLRSIAEGPPGSRGVSFRIRQLHRAGIPRRHLRDAGGEARRQRGVQAPGTLARRGGLRHAASRPPHGRQAHARIGRLRRNQRLLRPGCEPAGAGHLRQLHSRPS